MAVLVVVCDGGSGCGVRWRLWLHFPSLPQSNWKIKFLLHVTSSTFQGSPLSLALSHNQMQIWHSQPLAMVLRCDVSPLFFIASAAPFPPSAPESLEPLPPSPAPTTTQPLGHAIRTKVAAPVFPRGSYWRTDLMWDS